RAEELERQRQAVAAEKRREQKAEQARMEAQRVAEAERRAEEARIAEQKRREEAERRRREAEQRRLEAERQAQFRRELEAEEQRLAAITSGKQVQYLALIRNRVGRNWVRPASAKAGVECVVHVTQIPGGEVVNVRVGRCNGDAGVVRSIIAAVRKASPLPPPTDPTLFDRNLRFTFKPEE
ncbi:MAG: cell envelope integrity protein TolA, partial [Gammaproteobacteria bacterium]